MTQQSKIKQLALEDLGMLPKKEKTHKTPMMRYLELKYGKRIEDMLVGSNVSQVARMLGIDRNTVYAWRRRLGI